MRHFFAKSQRVGAAMVNETHGLLARLRRRPLTERKAMFFATFLIASALVLSFWTNQMHRRFGIAFLGSRQTSEVVSAASQTALTAREAGGLKKPFELARENLSLLKEDFVNLFSGLSSELKTASLGGGQRPEVLHVNGVVAEKEPPVAALGTAAKTVLSSDADEVPLATHPPQLSENKNISVQEPPLVKDRAYENSESKEGSPSGVLSAPTPGKAPSRLAAIIMTNLASIRQAFRDFYQYLTQ